MTTKYQINSKGEDELVGKRVRKIDFSIEGEVTALFNGVFQVIDADGFEWQMTRQEIVVIEDDIMLRQKLTATLAGGKKETLKKSPKGVDVIRHALEIDLHKYAHGSTPWEKKQSQISKFMDILQEYRGKHGSKLIFINGNGVEDALRTEMVKILKKHKNEYEYHDAKDSKYRFHTALQVVVK